jgi:hypothetical protein
VKEPTIQQPLLSNSTINKHDSMTMRESSNKGKYVFYMVCVDMLQPGLVSIQETDPTIRECVPQRHDSNCHISGCKFHSGLDTKTYWLTVSCKVTLTSSAMWVPCGGGLNTSKIVLSVTRGDEKEPSARGRVGGLYNWATLFLGDINTVTWPSRLGESEIRES